MTPEERANEVARLFGIAVRPEQDSGCDWGPKLVARIAKAIRQAEDAALERAAQTLINAWDDGEQGPPRKEIEQYAEIALVRSLKSGSVR